MSVCHPFIYTALVLEGPNEAILVATVNVLGASLIKRKPMVAYQVIFNVSTVIVATAVGWLAFHGTLGSASVGLRTCLVQPYAATPKPVWNPDIDQPIDFFAGWLECPDQQDYDNAFKVQWELFLRHLVTDSPFPWGLVEGAKGVQLAEKGIESWRNRAWVDVPELTV